MSPKLFGSILLLGWAPLLPAQGNSGLTLGDPLQFPSQVVGGITTPRQLAIRNSLPFTVSPSIKILPNTDNFDVPFFTPCGALPPGGICLPAIVFHPRNLGPQTATIVVFDSSSQQQYGSVMATGTGVSSYPSTNAYIISSRMNTLDLSVSAGSQAPGTNIVDDYPFVAPANEFLFTPLGNGVVKITSIVSGNCLDVAGQSTAQGAALIQWPYWGGPNEQWILNPTDSGFSAIESVNSGMVIDIAGQNASAGSPIDQWPYWGGTNQQWQIQAVGSLLPPFSGRYVIRSRHSQLLMAPATSINFMLPGDPVVQVALSSRNQPGWRLRLGSDGYYVITFERTDSVLEIPGLSGVQGTAADIWPFNGGENQEWKIDSTGDGYYTITSRNSGMVLDDEGMKTDVDTPVVQWPYWGGPNQQWQLIPVTD